MISGGTRKEMISNGQVSQPDMTVRCYAYETVPEAHEALWAPQAALVINLAAAWLDGDGLPELL